MDGHGSPDAVTSATCTVAADYVATHRSRFGYGYPAGMARALEQSAKHPAQDPVWSSDLGHGIMSLVAALSKLRGTIYESAQLSCVHLARKYPDVIE